MERIKRVVITWEDENWEYELELTGAEAEHFTESEAAAYAAQDAAENETTMWCCRRWRSTDRSSRYDDFQKSR